MKTALRFFTTATFVNFDCKTASGHEDRLHCSNLVQKTKEKLTIHSYFAELINLFLNSPIRHPQLQLFRVSYPFCFKITQETPFFCFWMVKLEPVSRLSISVMTLYTQA